MANGSTQAAVRAAARCDSQHTPHDGGTHARPATTSRAWLTSNILSSRSRHSGVSLLTTLLLFGFSCQLVRICWILLVVRRQCDIDSVCVTRVR
jgi:hypothetical protein